MSEHAELRDWLRGLSPDELAAYRAEIEAFEGDEEFAFSAFARAALPLVAAEHDLAQARELLRPGFEAVFTDDFDVFWEHLAALSRAHRQLDTDASVVDVFTAALETARERKERTDGH